MSTSTPRVSVIVPTYNDATRLRLCLGALEQQSLPRDQFEVIVVDNGSTDDTTDVLAEHPGIVAEREPQPGSYAARNRAIEIARGEILAFTDSDCIPAPDWLERALARFDERPDLARIAGAVEIFFRDPDRPTGIELYEALHAFPQQRYAEEHGFGVTANMCTRRSVVDAVGPFDATLPSGGDNEWGQRAKSAGFPITYAPEVLVRHPARRTLRELHRKMLRVHSADWSRTRRASRREWFRLFGRSLRPPVRSAWRARNNPLLRPRTRWGKYAWGALRVRCDGAWVTVRARVRRNT